MGDSRENQCIEASSTAEIASTQRHIGEIVDSAEKQFITDIGKIVIEQEAGLVALDVSDRYVEIELSDNELIEDGYYDFTDIECSVYEDFVTDLHYRDFKKRVAVSLEGISEQDFVEALAILLTTGPKLSNSTLQKFNALTKSQQEEILLAAAKTLARLNE